MARPATPSTPAVRLLRAQGVAFTEHVYRYEEHGGTAVSARELGVEEHRVVKTLVMQGVRISEWRGVGDDLEQIFLQSGAKELM